MGHGVDTPYTCGICGIIVNGLANFNIHKKVHDEKFECSHCKKQFLRLDDWLNHRLVTYNNHKQQKCDECGQVFSRNAEIDEHAKLHFICSDQTIECELCGKRFTTHELLVHMQLKHRHWPKLLPCTFCDHRAQTGEMLRLHCSLMHRRKLCGACGAVFEYEREFRDHVERSAVMYYRCVRCCLMFSSEVWTKAHVKESHPFEQVSFERITCTTCKFCSEVHGDIYSLNNHIRDTHLVKKKTAPKQQVLMMKSVLPAENSHKFVYVNPKNSKKFGRTYESKKTLKEKSMAIKSTDPSDSFEDEDSANEDVDLDYPPDEFETEIEAATNPIVVSEENNATDAGTSTKAKNLLDTSPVDRDKSLSITKVAGNRKRKRRYKLTKKRRKAAKNKQNTNTKEVVLDDTIDDINDHTYCKVLKTTKMKNSKKKFKNTSEESHQPARVLQNINIIITTKSKGTEKNVNVTVINQPPVKLYKNKLFRANEVIEITDDCAELGNPELETIDLDSDAENPLESLERERIRSSFECDAQVVEEEIIELSDGEGELVVFDGEIAPVGSDLMVGDGDHEMEITQDTVER